MQIEQFSGSFAIILKLLAIWIHSDKKKITRDSSRIFAAICTDSKTAFIENIFGTIMQIFPNTQKINNSINERIVMSIGRQKTDVTSLPPNPWH